MRLVLDAGAFIGIERADRKVAALVTLARRLDAELITVAPVIGQVWRNGAQQARLARAMPMIVVLTVTLDDARAAGELLRAAGTSDVVDALIALRARPGDQVLTSDPDDLRGLLAARGVPALVVHV